MDPKQLRLELECGIARAWEGLTEGCREVLTRSDSALTRFGGGGTKNKGAHAEQEFPSWSVLAGECWETAQSVIVRAEVPGMN